VVPFGGPPPSSHLSLSTRFLLAPLEDLHLTQSARLHGDADEYAASSTEEVEMGLLAGAEHASEGFGDNEESSSSGGECEKEMKAPLTREDKKGIALLIVLCALLPAHHVGPVALTAMARWPHYRLDTGCSRTSRLRIPSCERSY
jgi:hypothetical protein